MQRKRCGQNQGQALLEYALILIFVAMIVFASLLAFGPAVLALLNRAVGALP